MSRYVNTLSTGRTAEEAQRIISEYLGSEGFKYRDERGEMVWRKGTGALTVPQFMKAEAAADGTVHIEAWTAGVSLVPGVYGGEMDPTDGSIYGVALKVALKKRISELEARLGGVSVVPAGWYPDPTRRFEQRYWDGAQWTTNVVRGGQQATDPAGAV